LGVQNIIEPICKGPDGMGAYQIGGERSDHSQIICLDKRENGMKATDSNVDAV
jgi:hypothetical protein